MEGTWHHVQISSWLAEVGLQWAQAKGTDSHYAHRAASYSIICLEITVLLVVGTLPSMLGCQWISLTAHKSILGRYRNHEALRSTPRNLIQQVWGDPRQTNVSNKFSGVTSPCHENKPWSSWQHVWRPCSSYPYLAHSLQWNHCRWKMALLFSVLSTLDPLV